MIVTDVGGLKETIGDRGTGIVAADGQPETVAAEIIRYFNTPDLKDEFVKNIRMEKERLSWKRFASGLLEFAEELDLEK
jgi:glycosyltransferase involved in cell wall biosynthesis